jgi:hypothetical protein
MAFNYVGSLLDGFTPKHTLTLDDAPSIWTLNAMVFLGKSSPETIDFPHEMMPVFH